uniref:PE family protein n=1 Tax=Mycobacterium sp. HUMS_1102779 TaxID=3383487 RepID=UPI00389AE058
MSSFLIAAPEAFVAASADLTGIGSSIRAASVVASPSTTSVMVAAQDEVSAAVAALFGAHGQQFEALIDRAGLFHDQFVQSLVSGGGLYAAQEAANAAATAAANP